MLAAVAFQAFALWHELAVSRVDLNDNILHAALTARTKDEVTAGWPAYQEALGEAGKRYTMHMYEGANHGFHNDTTPRFDEEAAKLAQDRTITFFNEHLRD